MPMDCERWRAELEKGLDDGADPAHPAYPDHPRECPACRGALERARAAHERLLSLRDLPPPPARLDAVARARRIRRWARLPMRIALSAACLAAGAGLMALGLAWTLSASPSAAREPLDEAVGMAANPDAALGDDVPPLVRPIEGLLVSLSGEDEQ